MNRGKNKSEYSPTTATRAMRSQAANSSTITFNKNNFNMQQPGPPRPPATAYGVQRVPVPFDKIASPPKTGFAGKRDPTTYIVNDQGDIGINSNEMAKKTTFTHERTISHFATSQMSKVPRNDIGSFSTLSNDKSNLIITDRNRTSSSMYQKNKYGLTIKNLKNATSL